MGIRPATTLRYMPGVVETKFGNALFSAPCMKEGYHTDQRLKVMDVVQDEAITAEMWLKHISRMPCQRANGSHLQGTLDGTAASQATSHGDGSVGWAS